MRILVSLNQKEYPTFIPKAFKEQFILKTVPLDISPYSRNNHPIEIPLDSMKSSIAYSLQEPLKDSYFVKAYHSNIVVRADEFEMNADGHFISVLYSSLPSVYQGKKYLAIRTADCLAVAMSFENTHLFIASLTHAGWRGLSSEILQNTLNKMKEEALFLGIQEGEFMRRLQVHIAPAIFGVSYECGEDVKEALLLHREKLFSLFPESNKYLTIYNRVIDVNSDEFLQDNVGESIQKSRKNGVIKNKIFPDLQLLAALECVVSGIPQENIEILRENTYSHPVLFSFREATHKKTDKSLRQWTHLRFPFV